MFDVFWAPLVRKCFLPASSIHSKVWANGSQNVGFHFPVCLQQCSPADASHQCMAVPQHSCTQMGRRRWPPPWGTFKLSFGYLWVQFFAWFSHVVLGLLQEAQHGIHMGISFPSWSAAVRAQHMELKQYVNAVQNAVGFNTPGAASSAADSMCCARTAALQGENEMPM